MTTLRTTLHTLSTLGEVPNRFPRTPDDTLDTEHEEPDPDLATTGGDDE